MNKVVKIFNELINQKLAPQFGEVLLDCRLIGRNGGIGDYRYDLLFIFDREFNNPRIQLECVLKTCDELFDWIDLRDLPNLSIVIINKFGRNQHYEYFELMDEICRGNSYYDSHEVTFHPKYHEYMEWKRYSKMEKERRRAWEMEMGRVTRNELIQQTRMTESRKKKFLFW
jgi:hypothetical protein